MTKTLRRFVGATITADDLFERYKAACDLKQPVDREKIASAIRRWATGIGTPDVPIHFICNEEDAKNAARAAWDARDARAAWDLSYVSPIAIGASARRGHNAEVVAAARSFRIRSLVSLHRRRSN